MSEFVPPPLPPLRTTNGRRSKRLYLALGIAVPFVLASVLLIALRIVGLLEVFSLPTGAMVPAINPGDNFFVEGVTYLFSKPKRGDVVVFRTDEIPAVGTHELYVKRLIGLPGDRLHLSHGTIYINDKPTKFWNRDGQIRYADWSFAKYLADDFSTFTVPQGQYFVIGDCSMNSIDSRLWGGIPQSAVVGRAVYCYLSRKHVGPIK